MSELTHFNDEGRAKMVDVSEKAPTLRTATAAGTVLLNAETFALVEAGRIKKGRRTGSSPGGGDYGSQEKFRADPHVPSADADGR